MQIAINCELVPGTQAGGTQSALTGLLAALAALPGEERYLLLCHPENRAWVDAVAGPNMQVVEHRPPPAPLRRRLGRWVAEHLRGLVENPAWPGVPVSEGFYESLDAEVIHWPWLHFVVTALPAVFNPHDLLHLHQPRFFTARDIAAREALYPVACRLAHTVVAGSAWARQDFIARYGLAAEKVQTIPWAPPTCAVTAAPGMRAKYGLPEHFAFYPAVTWEHKNHLRLLAALAEVRDRHGVTVPLVCTGHRYPGHGDKVAAEVARLGLGGQVRFLGAVSFADLRGIYREAEFVIVPTLFEAASGPVFEAWQEEVPVGCSTVTSLPQQAGEAALLFDPWSVPAIAAALHRLATEPALREELRAAGRRRLADFSWARTAEAYRAVYRRAAGRPLSAEDTALLAWDWMAEPSRP